VEYWWIILLVTTAALTHYFSVGRYEGVLTLDGIFVLFQWIMAAGTLVLLDPSNSADQLYALVISVPMMLYVCASIVVYWIARGSARHLFSGMTRRIVFYRPTVAIWALLSLSGLVTIAYYQAVGYNTFASGIQGVLAGSSADYTTMRLDSYSASRYLYPGYVNQFKNMILPSLTLVVLVYVFKKRDKLRWLIAIPLILLSTFGILGTGQRGAFVQFCLILIIFLFHSDRKQFARRATLTGLAATPLLFMATFILGRSTVALGQDAGPFAKIVTIGEELLKRFFQDNQFSGQMGFRFTYGQPIQNGGEWITGFLGILPGQPGSPLPGQIFKSLYGTDRGTAPPSMWGSVFYNFGWFGLLVLPIVLATIYQVVTFRSTNKRHLNTLELVGMSGTFVVCGNWIAGGPEYLLNAGGVTFAILWWLGRRAAVPMTPPPDDDPPILAQLRPTDPRERAMPGRMS
jgi:oligosaccharide repeat unit polymerase